jgi:hypothetical protein
VAGRKHQVRATEGVQKDFLLLACLLFATWKHEQQYD